jgi:uncharacterized RDD family membrane protein YckC
MEYFYQDPKGEEIGPISEEHLINLAKDGSIDKETQVRNAMVKSFKAAEKVPVLAKAFKEVEGSFTDDKSQITKNLHRSASMVQPPSINYRLMAFFLDLVIICIAILVSYNLLNQFSSSLDETQISSIFLGLCVAVPVLYYGLTLGYKAQTFGYWFFGIMIIRGQGDPVLVGRAALSAFFFLLTLPLAPVLIYIFNKGLHETFAGIRVVKVKLG